MKHIEIHVIAAIPDGQDELGYEAIVATKEAVEDVVAALKKIGLEATQKRKLVTRHGERAAKSAAVKLAAAE